MGLEEVVIKGGPKVGLALGSGGARGLAHIGALQVLEEAGIGIDYISGTSMGAVIGGVYATETDLNLIGKLASQLSWAQLLEVSFSKKGLVKGDRIYELMELLTKGKTFEETNIPFAAVATDIESGDEVIIKEGLVADAIMASISIPGIFVPVRRGDMLLVDGAVVNGLPVGPLRDMGADIIIAISVEPSKGHSHVQNIFDVILQSVDIMQAELMASKTIDADIIIKPEVGHYTANQLDKAEYIIRAGRQATSALLPEIKKRLSSHNELEDLDRAKSSVYN